MMGSGTTAIVAAQNGRDYIGIDLNEKYAAIAEARIARWARQVTLFDMGAER
jgi:DNA modification methylase